LYCATGKRSEGLYVVEFGRARAMADMMSVEKEISVNPQSWVDIEKIIKKVSNSTCLYISYSESGSDMQGNLIPRIDINKIN